MITARARDVLVTKSANNLGHLKTVADDVSDQRPYQTKSFHDAYEARIDHRDATTRLRDSPDEKWFLASSVGRMYNIKD